MKKRHPFIVIITTLWIVLFSACSENSTQLIPTQTSIQATHTEFSEKVTETVEPDSTITNEIESVLQNTPTETITEILPTATFSPEPYPGNVVSDYDPSIQNPYPLTTDGAQIIDNNSNPYPGPSVSTPATIQTQNPYPAPGGNVFPDLTQPVAINPIQTPQVTGTIMVSNNISVTATMIVRTSLQVTDPTTVQLISGKYQLIEFFAFWCPQSKSMAPVINGLEDKYKGRISFVYFDIDNPATNPFKQALGYRNQPHFFLLDGEGKIIHQWRGFTLVDEFEAVLTPLFP
jgi:thiol-disulfide isomerase/thioredoxin